MRIAVGSDHGGFKLKEALIKFLRSTGHAVKDFGCFSPESCDYPVFAREVARAVAAGKFSRGILACKTGIGMAVAANKVRGVRAAVIHNKRSAASSRRHNDCNVIVFGSMFISQKKARELLKVWLASRPLGGRHRRRVNQINKMER